MRKESCKDLPSNVLWTTLTEMKPSAHLFLSPPDDLNEHRLLDFDLNEFKKSVKHQAPTVWKIFERTACSPEQEAKKKQKRNQDTVIL